MTKFSAGIFERTPLEAGGRAWRIGVLRLRRCLRFAQAPAALRMTGLQRNPWRLKLLLFFSGNFYGAAGKLRPFKTGNGKSC